MIARARNARAAYSPVKMILPVARNAQARAVRPLKLDGMLRTYPPRDTHFAAYLMDIFLLPGRFN
jgi:hypothetical protein